MTDPATPSEPEPDAPTWEQHVRGIAEDRVRWVDRVSVQLFVEAFDHAVERIATLESELAEAQTTIRTLSRSLSGGWPR